MLDSRLLGRLNFEQPLIGATLVGLVLGDIPTGLAVGAATELVSMGLVSVGAAVPPDMVLGSIVASAFACLTGAGVETAMTIAIPIAVLGQLFGIVFRSIIAALTHVSDQAIEEGKFKKATNMHIVVGTTLYSLMYFIPIFAAVFLGTDAVKAVVALLISMMLSKGMEGFLFLGFLLSAYLHLSVTAVSLFAVVLAVILSGIKFGRGGAGAGTLQSAHVSATHDPLEDDE